MMQSFRAAAEDACIGGDASRSKPSVPWPINANADRKGVPSTFSCPQNLLAKPWRLAPFVAPRRRLNSPTRPNGETHPAQGGGKRKGQSISEMISQRLHKKGNMPQAKKRRKAAIADVDQSVYGARDLLGTITARRGIIRAQMRNGKKLGAFKTSNAAMAAILAENDAMTRSDAVAA